MKEKFSDIKMGAESMALVLWADAVLTRYAAQGYTMSLRQLYYVGVTENLYSNEEASYKRLGDIITNGRMAGLLDWDGIEDRGRRGRHQSYWKSTGDILRSAADSFKINKWEKQKNHVEVMVEKSALEGIIAPICDEFEVPFHANKGYSSASAMYAIGKRLQERAHEGKSLHIIALFDHDASGLDMSRDLTQRLTVFSNNSPINVHRVALNIDQVHQYGLPENPAKMSDSRASAYVKTFGHSSWELDSLEPRVLTSLISGKLGELRDEVQWSVDLASEDSMKEEIQDIADSLRLLANSVDDKLQR